MPTYQYACTSCDHRLDAVQSFTDDPLTECPACAGRLRKLFSAVGIVFKGSGFYRTDSRGGAAKEAAGSTNGSAAEASGNGAGGAGGADARTAAGKSGGGKGDGGKGDGGGKGSEGTAKADGGSTRAKATADAA
ncbi:MAG TPA: FmdB family zinc ribbon protein [Micromonosporaceae bacterium]|nr:FmdB family zinc ribbon protein [Micromonosporaceae bacterium]